MSLAEKVIPLTSSNNTPSASSAADKIGSGIVTMLKQTALAARENADRAVRTSQRLAEQLQQFEERVKRLVAELKHPQERTRAAEGWLMYIQKAAEEELARFQAALEQEDTPPRREAMVGQ